MKRFNKGNKASTKPILKKNHSPQMLKKLALAIVITSLAATIYIISYSHTKEAETRRQLQHTQSQLETKKLDLEKANDQSVEYQKQLEEVNKKLEETNKQLQAKRAAATAYAATAAPKPAVAASKPVSGTCAQWMAQAGIAATNATNTLILKESGCRWWAKNETSGACGIPQAYPCSKLPCPLTEAGAVCQLKWMDNYVKGRYGSWDNALAMWYSRCGSPQGCWY